MGWPILAPPRGGRGCGVSGCWARLPSSPPCCCCRCGNNDDSRNGLHPSVELLIPAIIVAFVAAVPLTGCSCDVTRRMVAVPLVVAGLAALMALQHLGLGSEILRFVKNPGPDPRLAAAQELIARIPAADAPLAVTSQLGIHVPMRRDLYHFPAIHQGPGALVGSAYAGRPAARWRAREWGYRAAAGRGRLARGGGG
ncbi:MAG: hypothetical protein U0841_08270 [Chloroflexia bacterium]